jgi:hypothetical protein
VLQRALSLALPREPCLAFSAFPILSYTSFGHRTPPVLPP